MIHLLSKNRKREKKKHTWHHLCWEAGKAHTRPKLLKIDIHRKHLEGAQRLPPLNLEFLITYIVNVFKMILCSWFMKLKLIFKEQIKQTIVGAGIRWVVVGGDGTGAMALGEVACSGMEGVVCRRQKPRGITACRKGSIRGDFRVSRLGDSISVAYCEGTDLRRSKVGPSSQQPPLRFRQGIWRREVRLHLH